MSATTITLDYELTKKQLLTAWKEDVARNRSSWRSKFVSGAIFLLSIYHLGKVPWWMTAIELLFALNFWWMPRFVMWFVTTIAFGSRSTLPSHIEIDGQGLTFHSPAFASAPRRFEWSNLTRAKHTDFGIELTFKRRMFGALVPWMAFQDGEQQASFLELVDEHLPSKSHKSGEL